MIASSTGLGVDYALLVGSAAAALIVAMLLTSKTIVSRIGRFEAYTAVFALNVFPSGFYSVTPYSEFATLAFGFGAFVALLEPALVPGRGAGRRCSGAAAAGVVVLRGDGLRARARRVPAVPGEDQALVEAAGRGPAVRLGPVRDDAGAEDLRRRLLGVLPRPQGVRRDIRHWDRLTDVENYLKGFGSQHVDMVIWLGAAAVVALTAREVLRRSRPDRGGVPRRRERVDVRVLAGPRRCTGGG